MEELNKFRWTLRCDVILTPDIIKEHENKTLNTSLLKAFLQRFWEYFKCLSCWKIVLCSPKRVIGSDWPSLTYKASQTTNGLTSWIYSSFHKQIQLFDMFNNLLHIMLNKNPVFHQISCNCGGVLNKLS